MKKNSREGLVRIILHILAWSILMGLPFYSARRLDMGNDFLKIYYSFMLINGLIFYINYLILVPKFFFQKKRYKYYLMTLVLVIVFYFASDLLIKQVFNRLPEDDRNELLNRPSEERRNPGPPPTQILERGIPLRDVHIIPYLSSSLFLLFFSLGLRVLERQTKIEKMQEEMEREKLNSELAFLKNQISPHFFFNTLNNIYSLIGINADDSQKAVLKLSKLMRYLLYESEQGNTKLSQEIDFMSNYIDLMKLRMNDKVALSVSFPEKYNDVSIPPLLFIPFIENAFKHGISYREQSFIDISLLAGEGTITFNCSNSNFSKIGLGEKEHSGIGLGNIRKRLGLLYPDNHKLVINESDKVYKVHLLINFT